MFGNRTANTPALIGLIVALWLGSATVSAQIWPVPPGLNPGDQYRLVFVTSTIYQAVSSDITHYNSLVATRAAANSDLSGFGPSSSWKAIASTASKSALENTSTGSISQVKIYRFASSTGTYKYNLEIVADSYSDLWDGTLDLPIRYNEFGKSDAGTTVWSGTQGNGSGALNQELGTTNHTQARIGSASASDDKDKWINNVDQLLANSNRLYAMSGELTYSVPEPGSLGLGLVLALAGAAWCNRRRKRNPERSTNPAQSE